MDAELERCAPLALATLTTQAELITDMEAIDEAMKVSALINTYYNVLEGAARARGSLGESPHHFPENVVHESRVEFGRSIRSGSLIQAPGSYRIQDPGPWSQDPGSLIRVQGS